MIDYKNGKIYRIIDNTSEMVYIGSTCQTLTQRLAGHVRDFNRFKSGKTHYVSAFKIIENDDYDIVLLEEYPCENKEQLHKKERTYIESTNCVNINKPALVQKDYSKEYYEINHNKIKKYQEEYREKNKEKIAQRDKLYALNNQEKKKASIKQWREINAEIIKLKAKDYVETHKEKLRAYTSEKVVCECGKELTRQNLRRHKLSIQHLKMVQQKIEDLKNLNKN